jgi:hypothetical protein
MLVVIHGAWALFYFAGTGFRSLLGIKRVVAPTRGVALAEIIIDSATGMAVVGLATFLIALLGLLYPVTLALLYVVLIFAFGRSGDAPWRADFWRSRARTLRRAVSPAVVLLYLVGIVIGFQAAMPDLGSDATSYHMVYAIDWAQSHRLIVDMTLRAPFSVNNWLLLDACFVELGGERFASALSWLCGLLTLFGIYAFVIVAAQRTVREESLQDEICGSLAAASVVLCAIFVRWVDFALVDVPIGFMFLVCGLIVIVALRTKVREYLGQLVICAAFLVGMKISLIALAPMFLLVIWLSGVSLGIGRRRIFAGLLSFCALSSPWYVKNFIQAGDPISPTLNIAFHGVDPKWSRADVEDVLGDLKSQEGGPISRLSIPLQIVNDASAWVFRERGVTLIILLLGLPVAYVAFMVFRRRDVDVALCTVAAMVSYAIGYWIATSYLARYSLLFYPAFAAFVGSFCAILARAVPAIRWVAISLLAVLALPSLQSRSFYDEYWHVDRDFLANYHDRESWLLPRQYDYPEIEMISRILHRNGRTDLRVYRPFIEVDDEFFRSRGITAIGDVFGPERYADFFNAIYADTIQAYIKRFHIGVFLLPLEVARLPAALRQRLGAELHREHFREIPSADGRFVIFTAPGLK